MRNYLLPLAAIISATTIFQLSNSVLTSLIPIRLGLAGVGGFATSSVAMAFSLGFLIGCLRSVHVIKSVGHIRAFATFAGATAVTTLMLEISVQPILWFVLRLAQGVCLAGLFTIADSWINERTPNEVRGRVLGTYFIVITCALVIGQLLLYFFDATSAVLIMIVSGLFSLALIPVALTTSASPRSPELATVNPWRLYKDSPVAVFGCFAVGAMSAALLNMLPYFMSSVSVPAAQIGLMIGSIHVARLVLQWPIGLLSDRMDRRIVIVGSCILVASLSIVIILIAPGGGQVYHDPSLGWLKLPLFALFGSLGAFSMLLYSICIAQAHDRTSPEASVAVTSTLLLVWSVGSIVGLLLLGIMMDVFGVFVLLWFTGGTAVLLAVHTGWRMAQREAPEQPGQFRAFPDTSPIVSELEPLEEEEEEGPKE